MSTIIGKIIPTIDQQIAWLRKDRTMMENSLTLLEDPKDIGTYEEEIVMLKAIEENLIAVRNLSAKSTADICAQCGSKTQKGEKLCPKCAISAALEEDKGEYKFRNPVQRGAGDDYPVIAGSTDEFPEPHMEPVRWPRVGDSVMVNIEHHGKSEWVDAYVVEDIDGINRENGVSKGMPGVIVKTYWGALYGINDIGNIQFSKKEVSNG